MECIYINLDEHDKRPSARFRRWGQLSVCNACVFAVFNLATFSLRKSVAFQPEIDTTWRLLFYGFWPLVLMAVGALLAVNFRTGSWVDSTQMFMLLGFSMGSLSLLLALVAGLSSFLLRIAVMCAIIYSAWRWWDSMEIVHFDSNTLFYANKNISAFVLGWWHVNLCFLAYAVLAMKLRRARALAGAVYFLLLSAGLAGFAARVYGSERIFGLKNFGGFLFATLGGGLAFCLG